MSRADVTANENGNERPGDDTLNSMVPPVSPLITASDAYPALERAAIKARSRILLSFRIFDTRTRLRTDDARARASGDDWAALLATLAADGIDTRIQVSDFDPVAGADLHRDAWASLRHLDAVVANTPGAAGRIEAMAARHPASVGPVWRRLLAVRAWREVRQIKKRHDGDLAHDFPGLTDVKRGKMPQIYPATHHQKLAIVDETFALIGGLDVNERRWDTTDHDKPADETWRDASLAVHGVRAAHVAHAAERVWAQCAVDYNADRMTRPDLPNLSEPRTHPVSEPGPVNDFAVKMTVSVPNAGLFSFGPRTRNDDTLQTVLSLITQAKRFIYIETQFLRSARVARALADAARRNGDLELMIVLPFAPEHVAFDQRQDTAIRHAEALQAKAIARIRDAFGVRASILSPAKPTRRDESDGFVAYGAGIVYVHSKILIVDGHMAFVGSANLNDRSLLWDTEASALWCDPNGVAAFFRRIADSWLGSDEGAIMRSATWQEAAIQNSKVVPDLREGFLLPYVEVRPRRFGKWAFWLPDALF